MTRIAIDAMGGDHAPHEIVAGAVWAAKEYGVAIELVGKQDRIEQELDKISQEGFMTDLVKAVQLNIVLRLILPNSILKLPMLQKLLKWVKPPGRLFVKRKSHLSFWLLMLLLKKFRCSSCRRFNRRCYGIKFIRTRQNPRH